MNKIEQAKDYLINKFKPEYKNYIENTLAGDFACELEKALTYKENAENVIDQGGCVKESTDIDLLINETQCVAICITNEDRATENDISTWVDDIVENLETIRKTLHQQGYLAESKTPNTLHKDISDKQDSSEPLDHDWQNAKFEPICAGQQNGQSKPFSQGHENGQCVDLEGLKKTPLRSIEGGFSLCKENEGWNACIDHLQSQGLICADGWRDIESAPRDGYALDVNLDEFCDEMLERLGTTAPLTNIGAHTLLWELKDKYLGEIIKITAAPSKESKDG